LHILGEVIRRAFDFNPDFLAWDNFFRIVETIKDPLADIFNDAFEFNGFTFITKKRAALIPGICRPPARRA
jgi:hypothetical protein